MNVPNINVSSYKYDEEFTGLKLQGDTNLLVIK